MNLTLLYSTSVNLTLLYMTLMNLTLLYMTWWRLALQNPLPINTLMEMPCFSCRRTNLLCQPGKSPLTSWPPDEFQQHVRPPRRPEKQTHQIFPASPSGRRPAPESLFDKARCQRNIGDLAPILVSTPSRAEISARQASAAKNQPEVQ